jgi:mono/diheme cytochrome c family protein
MGVTFLKHGSRPSFARLSATLGLARRGLLLTVTVLAVVGVMLAAGWRWVNASSGPQLYADHCVECHGPKGGRIPAAPLDSPTFMAGLGEASVYRTIAEGKGTMPAWGKSRGGPLGDDQIRNLVTYLLSPQRAGPGRDIYQAQCASCHGDQGNRIPAAMLNDRRVLDQKTDQQLTTAIAEGKGAMAGLGQAKGGPLSDQDVAAVVTYMRPLAGSLDPGARGSSDSFSAASSGASGSSSSGGSAAAKAPADPTQQLFSQNCSGCHANLSLNGADPTAVAKNITDGIAAKGMPAFGGRLSSGDITALAQLLVSGKASGGSGGNPFAGIVRHADGWITKHPPYVKENGTQLCARCHQPTFCVNCHTAGRVK